MIFFFCGPNTYAARQQIAKLVAEYTKKTGSNLGLERLDGARLKSEELTATLQAVPFLSRSRLVIIEDLGSNKAIAPNIASYLKGIPATTVAVFYDPAVDQRGSYVKQLPKPLSSSRCRWLSCSSGWYVRRLRPAPRSSGQLLAD